MVYYVSYMEAKKKIGVTGEGRGNKKRLDNGYQNTDRRDKFWCFSGKTIIHNKLLHIF